MASADSHYGQPGYEFLGPQPNRPLVGEGLVAALAEENTRRGVFAALYIGAATPPPATGSYSSFA